MPRKTADEPRPGQPTGTRPNETTRDGETKTKRKASCREESVAPGTGEPTADAVQYCVAPTRCQGGGHAGARGRLLEAKTPGQIPISSRWRVFEAKPDFLRDSCHPGDRYM